MITRIVDWIAGREPVASATGIAGVITAILGVVAALGVDLSPELIAAIGTLAAAIAGWLARKAVTPIASPADRQLQRLVAQGPPPPPAPGDSADDGGVPLALIILIAVGVLVIGGFFASCDALLTDEDEEGDLNMGLPALILDHDCYEYGDCGGDEYRHDYSSRDRNRNRGRDRGAFSPGPNDDSFNGNTVCLPGSTCYTDGRRDEEPR